MAASRRTLRGSAPTATSSRDGDVGAESALAAALGAADFAAVLGAFACGAQPAINANVASVNRTRRMRECPRSVPGDGPDYPTPSCRPAGRPGEVPYNDPATQGAPR